LLCSFISEADSEERFNERVKKNIENNLQKKQHKHDQWQSKMDKRLARNKILDEKRRKRLDIRANNKTEHMNVEKLDASARRTRRREHFLLSYQSVSYLLFIAIHHIAFFSPFLVSYCLLPYVFFFRYLFLIF
jgi:hypothetical protein